MPDETSTVSAAARADSPYVGLNYYTEADADWFFGRDEESHTIIANLRASRLTILFSQSGVGKSSLLRAGVVHQIRELAQRRSLRRRDIRNAPGAGPRVAERSSPRYVPLVFNEWKDDPVADLIGAIEKAIEPLLPEGEPATLPRDGLRSAIETAASAVDAKLLIILDQFEEYFLYRSRERGRLLADELAECVNDGTLRANFMIAIREDAYAGLGDLFAGKLANVYGNYLQLEYLDRAAARATIVKPIEHFNAAHPQDEPIEIEPELVEAVLDQVRTGEVIVAQGGQGTVNGGNGASRRRNEIETPYLQLVMSTLWTQERQHGSRVLRLATLQELGGAQEIVRTYLDGALAALPEDQRDTALDLFRYLVTPSGTKIVYAASDLAVMVDRPADRVAGLLEDLDHKRIVRHVPPPAGKAYPDDRYEIFHDVLAPAIVDWRRRALEQRKHAEDARERERLEREKHEAEERARRDRRQSRILMVLLGLVVAVGVLAFIAWRSAVADRNTAQSRQIAASANANLARNPERSTVQALAALHKSHTAQGEAALRRALPLLELRRTLKPGVSVTGAAYSPDGSLIVTTNTDGVARIWDASSHDQVGVLGQPGLALNGAAFSPNGTLVATAGNDGTARIWNVSTHKQEGKPIQEPTDQPLTSVAFGSDGKRLVTASEDGTARIWDATSADHAELGVATPRGETSRVNDAQFSLNGEQIVTAGGNGKAIVWNAPSTAGSSRALTERYALTEPSALLSAAFSRNEKLIVTTSNDGSARIWNAEANAPTPPSLLPEENDATNSAAFSPDSKLLVTANNDGSARIFEVASRKQLPALTAAGADALNTAVFAPDGTHVLTASADGTARIWDRAHPQRLGVPLDANGSDALERASFSAEGKLIAVAGRDGTASVWEVATGRRLAVIAEPSRRTLTDVVFDPQDPEIIVTGSEDGTAYVWNIGEGRGEPIGNPPGPVTAVAFASNGDRLAVATPNSIETFDTTGLAKGGAAAAKPQPKFKVPTNSEITDVAFNPNGTLLVTAGADGDARTWSDAGREVGKPIVEPEGGYLESARFSPDGGFIVTASQDGTARIWNIATRREEGDALTEPGDSVLDDAEFNGDGSRILTVSTDGVSRVWDASTHRQLVSLAGHEGRIISGAFSPVHSSNLIATSSSDGTVKLWRELPRQQQGPALVASPTEPVSTVAVSPNGQIVTAGARGFARIWSTSTHMEVGELETTEVLASARFSSNGQLIVTAGAEGNARIWNAHTHHEEAGTMVSPSKEPLGSAGFSPNNDRLLVAAGGSYAYIWERGEHPKLVGTIRSPLGGIASAAFSPSGRQIVTASNDGTARIWEGWGQPGGAKQVLAKQVLVLSEPGGAALSSAAFNMNGELVVTASEDGTARVWNATTGASVQVLEQPGHGELYSAVFSPDAKAKEVLTASGDGTAVIWDRSSATALTQFPVGDGVRDAVFTPDGSKVVTGDTGGATRVWSTQLAGSLAAIERVANEWVMERPTSAELEKFDAG